MFRVAIFFISIFLITSCTLSLGGEETTVKQDAASTDSGAELIASGSTETNSGEAAISLSNAEKIAQLKRRRSLADIISKGDFFALRNDPETALAYYQESIQQVPDDFTLKRKIANIYYSMKDWNEAYSFYIQVSFDDLSQDEQHRLYMSLFFSTAISDRLTELARIPGLPEQKEYYTMIDTCYTGIHNCVVALEAYTGSVERILALKSSMNGYEKISEDFHYRNLLLSAELYKQGQYRASSILSREIYDKRPDYFPNLKILGFSLYELGRYDDAKTILETYYVDNADDVDTIYLLGEIAFFLHDPLTSNMYLNNAVTKGYVKKTDIERRMAYNYYTLMDLPSMIKVLRYLIKEPDVTEDDFAVAVYTSIDVGDSAQALDWVNTGLEKFSESSRLLALKARALRTLGLLDDAEQTAELAYALDGTNALAMLELGYIRSSEGNYSSARSFLEHMLEVSNDSTFADEAEGLLMNIASDENVNTGSAIQEYSGNVETSTQNPTEENQTPQGGPGGAIQ